MGEKRGKGKGGGVAIPPEDALLWKLVTEDVAPLHEPKDMIAPPAPEKTKAGGAARTPPPPAFKNAPKAAEPPQLDARTDRRLRRGQMEIEARLDLHGLTQAAAQDALTRFILNAAARGLRCVLVITGKGKVILGADGPGGGVLRQKCPLWLAAPPLSDCVLKSVAAAPKHGGQGALYVYLKRRRER